MLVSKDVNMAKGRIFLLHKPYDLEGKDRIVKGKVVKAPWPDNADHAVQRGNEEDIQRLLSMIRSVRKTKNSTRRRAQLSMLISVQVFAVFDYINDPSVSARANRVRNNIHIQLGYIETATGQRDLVRWWDVWSDDFFSQVASKL